MLATALVTLLAILARTKTVVGQDNDQVSRGHYIFLSHLSPLIEYSPTSPSDDPDALWSVSLARHATNHTGSSIKLAEMFLGAVYISGNASNIEGGFETLGDEDKDNTDLSFTQIGSIIASVQRRAFIEPRNNVYNITIKTNSSDENYMEIDGVSVFTDLPAWRDGTASAIHRSATNADSDFYQDQDDAWTITEPPSNQSVGVQFALAAGEVAVSVSEYPYNSTVLSTTQVGSPLRFTVPPYTSFLQWYGTVGPDQGRYEFRLIPTGDQDPQFQPISLNQTYTGERAVDANYETKGVAWLDPRVSYDAEIELLEEGKRTDLHGVSFWRYTPIDAEIQDWWSAPKDDSLSGGQIAGIVVGSVAGAALIGLAIWFLVRRRKRSRTRRSGSDAEKLQS